MTKREALQLFEERKVRTVWDTNTEEWYFVVVDVIGAITDSVNPTDYIKKLKKEGYGSCRRVGTNCHPPFQS